MSSIAHPYEKQIRRLIIAEVASTAANITAFLAETTPLSIKAFSENGTAVEYGKPFFFAYRNAEGTYRRSDIIRPETVEMFKQTVPVQKVGKVQTFKINAVTEGKPISLSLSVNQGLNERDRVAFIASAKPVAGSTPTTVAKELAVQLAKNLARDLKVATNLPGTDTVGGEVIKKNKYFTIAVATDTITITEKDWVLDGFKVGLREYDQLMWNAEIASVFGEADASITKTVTAGVYAKNKGYEVAAAEHYLQMHSQSMFSGDVETTLREPLAAKLNVDYTVTDASYFAESLYDPQKSDKMISIASPTAAVNTAVKLAFDTAMIAPTEA